jgi:hypothetical protein
MTYTLAQRVVFNDNGDVIASLNTNPNYLCITEHIKLWLNNWLNTDLWKEAASVFGTVNRICVVICQNCGISFEPSEYFPLFLSSKDRHVLNHFYTDLMVPWVTVYKVGVV